MNTTQDLYISLTFEGKQRFLLLNAHQTFGYTMKKILDAFGINQDQITNYVLQSPTQEFIISNSQLQEGTCYMLTHNNPKGNAL